MPRRKKRTRLEAIRHCSTMWVQKATEKDKQIRKSGEWNADSRLHEQRKMAAQEWAEWKQVVRGLCSTKSQSFRLPLWMAKMKTLQTLHLKLWKFPD